MAEKKTGFFSGIGYLGERIGAGFMQSVEGIWDFSAGGLADLFGADEWAEEQLKNNWFGDWYNSAGDWYDAKGGWKIAGDVASGIGTTLPALATTVGAGVAVYLSGSTAAPIALKAIAASASPLVAGLGAAGTSTKEAYDKTGKLTGKEYGYGALTGVTEGAIEGVTNMIGLGVGSVYKGLAGGGKAALKGATEVAAKQTVKSVSAKIAKGAAGSFASEAFEEGLAEILSPQYARWTYDPDAEYATAEEVAYAALVGGLAGVVMTGAGKATGKAITTVENANSGKKAIEAGQADTIKQAAKAVSDAVANGETEYELLGRISGIYNSMKGTDTYVERAKLGELRRLLSVARILPNIEQSALNIIQNPQGAIEAYGSMLGEGTTAQDLIKGIKTDGTPKENMAALRRAISENRALGTLAIAEATGRLMVDHETYLSNATTGGYLGGRAQYQDFVANASPEQKAALAQLVGAENLDAVDYETFAKRMTEYGNSPEGSAKIRSARDIRNRAENIPANEKTAPPAVSAAMEDGVHRFGGADGIAIIKNGDTVRIYDYETRNITRSMTVQEATAALQKARRGVTGESTGSRRYSLPEDIDDVNISQYNEIKLSGEEMARLQSEAMTWGANERGVLRHRTLGDFSYTYVMDADGIVHCYGKEPSQNIHEWGGRYDNGNSRGSDRLSEKYRFGQERSTGGSQLGQDRRESSEAHANDGGTVHREGESDRGRHRQDAPASRGRKKIVRAKFDEDGSGHGVKYYSDGTSERFALPKSGKNITQSDKSTTKSREITADEIAAFAKENVKGYEDLLPAEQREIRAMIRQGKALGVPDADIKTYARVSARSGIRVAFSKERTVYTKEDGTRGYADGFYDPVKNEIVVNPEGTRSPGKLLMHELSHALYSYKKYRSVLEKATQRMDEARAEQVTKQYREAGESAAVISEELLVHHAEDVLGSRANLERVVAAEPNIKSKILSFFRLAKTDYAGDSRLSLNAGRLYRHFEKAFNDFAARNRGNLAAEGVASGIGRMALSDVDKTSGAEYNKGKEKIGGKDGTQESGNAGVLERRTVSAVDGSDDHIRKQNKNTKSLQGFLGYDDVYVRENNIRAGESGWLEDYQGDNESGKTNDQQRSRRFLQSILGRLSRTELKQTDTVGRYVPENVVRSFSETAFKTEDGKILSLWHWTDKKFSEFKYGDIGFHVGILKASHEIMSIKGKQGEKGYYKEFYLNSKNPLVIDRDLMHWTPGLLSYYSSVFTEDESSILSKLPGFLSQNYESPASYRLREMLKQKGYDSIIYPNEWEGGFSVIAFDNDQLYLVAENGILAEGNSGVETRRKALPDTTDAVGKTKKRYEPSKKEIFFTAKDRAYIETVDELYGIEKYLHKIGGTAKATVEADVQLARAARSQAQTMIGSVQYNVFSDKPERMGDGLLEIYKPTRLWSQEKYTAFDNYLLHQLNIDRMTLESRSKAWTAAERAQIVKVEGDIATLNTQMKTLRADIRKAETAIDNAKVRRGTAKLAATKARWQAQVDALTKQKATDEADLEKAKRDTKRKIAELRRLRKELKALELKNKPVFGKDETLDEQGNMKRDHDITADESRAIVAECEKKYPEFAEIAKKLYTYLDNLQTMRVEAGLISRESADYMKKLYPHYVPSYRDTEGRGISVVKGKNNLEISRTVRKAKGGNQDILDVASSIATQTDELMKAGRINQLAAKLYDAAKSSGDTSWVQILSEESVGEEESFDDILRPKPGQLTFYRDGKKVTMEVSKEILLGFEALRSPTVDLSNPLERTMAKINSLFKRGVTSLNPAFMLRNPIRDLQDAGLNSRHPAGFAKAMAGVAQKGILVDDPDFQLYRALGGFSSTVFDGVLKKQSGYAGFDSLKAAFDTDAEGIRKVWDKMTGGGKAAIRAVENANAFLEQMTRFAEFKASLAAGDSPAVALNNSAEVTTNFGRRGRLTKKLNATLMPFLNPAIQGFDKIFRNVGDAFTGGHMVRGVASLLTKAALIGALPMVLNRLMYDDDEDYEKLRETDKENYFLVKIGDGHFIKIPRGRLAAVIGGAYNRTAKAARGEDPELLDYLDNAKSQITPVENVSRNIFSPLFDVRNNRTWYGGEIEGREFDATAPRERYDESTSRIAVAIGSIIPNSWNFSPKKIHYLLDQYSGVVGDFVLPATTEKEHKGFFSGNFTLDSVTSNKLSEKFYDLYDKTQYADTAGDEAAAYRLKYLNRVKKSIRTLNEELEAIRTGGYSNTEKLARTRTVRALINAEYDAALKSIGVLDEAIEATAAIGDEVLRDAEVTRRVFGAESALENYNKKSYERYTLFHKAGVGFDELYAYHFATLGLENDTDKRGNVIEGSKRKKIVSIINSLDIPKDQKLLLLASKGYAAKDGEIPGIRAATAKTMLQRYIVRAKLTKAEKEALAKACGFTVKNGAIVND